MSLAKPPEAFMGYVFKNPALLEEALTHKSFKESPNNQRLEFLGDAVLSLIASDMLMKRHPQSSEGFLTKKRLLLSAERLFLNWQSKSSFMSF